MSKFPLAKRSEETLNPQSPIPMPDCLDIDGIRAFGYVGVLPEEKTLGQWYEASLSIWLDLAKAGKNDDLADTYDYRLTIEAVQQLIQTARFDLIERLADAIATHILTNPKVEQVRVRVKKVPPIPGFSGSVTVDIVRSAPVR